jgi:DNA mismatch endonuclease (patch repair protein)
MTSPAASSPAASNRMRANRRRNTRPEMELRSELHRRGLRFRIDMSLASYGIRVRPDVVFPRLHLAVFVDGCFWHRCPIHSTMPHANAEYWKNKLAANVDRDRRNTKSLEEAGWSVLRVWAHIDPSEAASLVEAALADAPEPRAAPLRRRDGPSHRLLGP